ncbi:MAG: succinylglutamate desuccinylase/aspartoacylase family protein, partial [Bdellovibrionales bacterium]|nr:succinylglutamate desuccinylase/aspartoacylase family protein [Bdellovibrionales bacterium]
PVLGLTAALHGNELNGIPVIHRLMQQLNLEKLAGTIVGALVLNMPGLLRGERYHPDGTDMNRIAPGKPDGNQSELYIYRLTDRLLPDLNYLIDLHTASFGRVNSYYVRADMGDDVTSRMARLQNPQIILNNPPNDRTLRGHAATRGIKSITLELKDPFIFQYDVIEDSLIGLRNVLYDLQMLEGSVVCPLKNTIVCDSSYWTFTDRGGILTVFPELGEEVGRGQHVGQISDIFGEGIAECIAPDAGIIIGKSVSPVNPSGSRIIHLGLRPKEVPCVVS